MLKFIKIIQLYYISIKNKIKQRNLNGNK